MSLLPVRADTGSAFYGDPPDQTHPWAVHDRNRPQPPRVEPGTEVGQAPSDATILFDGSGESLSNWVSDKEPDKATDWEIRDGALQCKPGSGYIRTKEEFGDCQLHLEWAAPTEVKGDSQGRGNSGVFLMGQVEIQVLDNYDNPTYADGFASSVYGVSPAMVNALRPPGQWQSYDIVFRRPVYDGDKLIAEGYVTILVNGVASQDHAILEGGTGHKARSKPGPLAKSGPLKLQDHGNPVRYRNIWIRPLPARTAEGGTVGQMTAEATAAKRTEIAAKIRADSSKLEGMDNSMRLAESLVYDLDPDAQKSVEQFFANYADSVKELKGADAEAKKRDILHVRNALQFLINAHAFPTDDAVTAALNQVVEANAWKD